MHIVVGLVLGAAVNMTMNFDELTDGSMSFEDYCKSAGVGALAGGVSAATGPFGAAAMAGLNEMHEQTIRGKNIEELDFTAVAVSTATGFVGSKVGAIADDIGSAIPKGPYRFKEPSLFSPAPLAPGNFKKLGQILAEPMGAFFGDISRKPIEEIIYENSETLPQKPTSPQNNNSNKSTIKNELSSEDIKSFNL